MTDYDDSCACGHYRYQHHDHAGPGGMLSGGDVSARSGQMSSDWADGSDWAGSSEWDGTAGWEVPMVGGDTACGICSCLGYELQ